MTTISKTGEYGCPHEAAPNGCSPKQAVCACGWRIRIAACGNDAEGDILVRRHEDGWDLGPAAACPRAGAPVPADLLVWR